MAKLKTYKEKVFKILKDHMLSRNDDGLVIAYYIKYHQANLVTLDINRTDRCIKLKDFIHLDPIENITRARRIIQNEDGHFLPTDPAVRKQRKIKEKEMPEQVREAVQHAIPYRDQ